MRTKSEKEDHKLAGHLPFRSWCEHWIRGKGHEAGHYKTKEKKDALPEVHVSSEEVAELVKRKPDIWRSRTRS